MKLVRAKNGSFKGVVGVKGEDVRDEVFRREGEVTYVDIAQKGTGIRTQFSPAPAICAKSSSVCSDPRSTLVTSINENAKMRTHDK